MDAKAAIDVLREVGVKRLAGTDGCLCMSCAVQGVTIDVSCRKSGSIPGNVDGHLIRVYSHHMDAELPDLQLVAEEVAAQLSEDSTSIAIRLCEYRIDRDMLCLYCEKPRTDERGYFCDDHQNYSRLDPGHW